MKKTPSRPITSILLIEDDRFIGEMYVRSLKKAGYATDWVISGQDGVNAFRAKTYDLVLLDIMLPEKTGVEVLETLRREKSAIASRVIVMTNYEQDEASRTAMENNADGYLIKADITPRKLIEIIKSMSASSPSGRA